jgi:hypothetical protein
MPFMFGRAARVGLAFVVALLADVAAAADPVPVAQANQHIGEQVTLEGRVVATHSSSLATVLAFAPNFAGFTAKILAGDQSKFPVDLDRRYRDRVVRLTGEVTDYRGKPEMTLRDPTQLVLVLAPGETPAPLNPPSPSPTPAASAAISDEIARTLASIDAHLAVLEERLGAIEQIMAAQHVAAQQAAAQQAAAREARPVLGLPANAVRDLLGEPVEVARRPLNGTVWLYGQGRSVTFDGNGRVIAWAGF